MSKKIIIPEDVLLQEKNYTGTSWTHHESFDKEGYFVIKDLWDPMEMICEPPKKKGQYFYKKRSYEEIQYNPVENQVVGSHLSLLVPTVSLYSHWYSSQTRRKNWS